MAGFENRSSSWCGLWEKGGKAWGEDSSEEEEEEESDLIFLCFVSRVKVAPTEATQLISRRFSSEATALLTEVATIESIPSPTRGAVAAVGEEDGDKGGDAPDFFNLFASAFLCASSLTLSALFHLMDLLSGAELLVADLMI